MKIITEIKQYHWHIFSRGLKFFLKAIGIRYEVYLYCIKVLSQNNYIKVKPHFSGQIKELTFDSIITSELIIFTSTKIELFKKRLSSNNYKGYGFYHKGVLVYYTWISFKDFEMSVPASKLYLGLEEGLLIDSYCHPNYRSFGIHQYMNEFRLNILLENGKKKAVVIVLKENLPARITQKKSGFHCEKLIKYKKVWKYEQTNLKSIKIDL